MNRRSFLSLGIVLAEPRRAYSFIWNNPVAVAPVTMATPAKLVELLIALSDFGLIERPAGLLGCRP